MAKRIWGVQCTECGLRMFSFFRHDYKTCGCPTDTMVDGGRDYVRCGWNSKGKPPKNIYWTEKKDGKYPSSLKEVKSRWPY